MAFGWISRHTQDHEVEEHEVGLESYARLLSTSMTHETENRNNDEGGQHDDYMVCWKQELLRGQI